MMIYIILLLSISILLLIFSNFNNGKIKNEYEIITNRIFICIVIILVLIQGFRAVTVGGDLYDSYAHYYNWFGTKFSWERIIFYGGKIEKGYIAYNKLIYLLTNGSFQLFIFSISLIFHLSLARLIKKYSNNIIYSLFIYIAYGMFNISMNSLRSIMGLSIIFWGLPYLIEKKHLKFLGIILVASLFHRTMLSFSVLFVLSFFNVRNAILMFSGMAVLLYSQFDFLKYRVLEVMPYMASHFTTDRAGHGYYMFTLYLLLAAFLKLASKKIFLRDRINLIFFYMFLNGCICKIVAFETTIAVRMVYYYLFALAILIPNYIQYSRVRCFNTLIFFLWFFVYWMMYANELYQDYACTIPYETFWESNLNPERF